MNKQLYIPEIGTEIKLTEDWTFILYCEGRNSDLLELLGYKLDMTPSWNYVINSYQIRIDTDKFNLYETEKDKFYKTVKQFQKEIYQMDSNKIVGKYCTTYPLMSNKELNKKEKENSLKETLNFLKTISKYATKEPIKTIIPKNSTLVIDRIYIRKNKKDYSSVSFYWKDRPIRKGFKNYVRFWAKLEDVNKIIYE